MLSVSHLDDHNSQSSEQDLKGLNHLNDVSADHAISLSVW